MMNPEQLLWQRLRRAAGDGWHAQRHEDRISTGIPDVSYALRGDGRSVSGWLELKVARCRRDVVRVSHPGQFLRQVRWMLAREHYGQPCHVFAEIVCGRRRHLVLLPAGCGAVLNGESLVNVLAVSDWRGPTVHWPQIRQVLLWGRKG